MYKYLDKFLVAKAKEKAGMKGKEKEDWGEKEDWDEDGDGKLEWPAKDGWMSSEEFEAYIEEWKWWVQLIFLMIAFGNAAKFGVELFRYRRPDNYYVNGKLGGSEFNWWELGNQIFLNGGFYILALAFVTQGLSLFGILPTLNFYVWEIGVFFGFGILNAVYGWMSWKTYDEAYGTRRNRRKDKSVTEIAAATAVQADIQREWNAYAIEEIMSFFTIYPLIPYFYAAMGYCEGYDVEQWHERCPEDWQKDVWEMAHWDREEGREERERKKDMMEKKGKGKKEEDYEVWEEDEDEVEEEEEPIVNPADETIDDPTDPFGL